MKNNAVRNYMVDPKGNIFYCNDREAVDFDESQAGKSGYIFYDWTGDGKYDHVEFCYIHADGLTYSFYNNNGFEQNENFYTRSFANDSNAGALNGGP